MTQASVAGHLSRATLADVQVLAKIDLAKSS